MSEIAPFSLPEEPPRGPVWCPECGKFAKYLGGHHYFNGEWDCYSFRTDCKTCGIQTTECV